LNDAAGSAGVNLLVVVRGRLHGCARGRRTRGGREYGARFVVAALLQFLCGDGGGARVAGAVVKMEAAREVAERSREEENGVAMVALRSCDGGRKWRCEWKKMVVVADEMKRCGNSRWSERKLPWWMTEMAAAAAVESGRRGEN